MKINIQARGFELADSLREHAERHLRFALGWADDHLRQVSVRLSSQSGPRASKNKRCLIQIDFPGAQDVIIEDIEDDIYIAIDRAADRASRSVARQLERLRDHRHGPAPAVGADDTNTLPLH
ncbi:MAG: HPF/RaiA family ribosome-associated protein [Candidatus Competibacteraceae bacterium]|nr:MAG: HPF/RaiA family ribosome-associated protein [Candidatus Competibacteraceae bacterium]